MSTGSWTHDPGKCSAKVATARTYSKNKPFCNRTVVDDGLCRIHLAVRERAKTRAPKPTYAELRSALDAVEARLAAVRDIVRDVATDAGDDRGTYGETYHAGMVTVAARIRQALAIDAPTLGGRADA